MGLDIDAYSSAVLTPEHDREGCWDSGLHVRAFVLPGLEHSLRGLLADRCYDVSGGEVFSFRAGSYSGYGEFRKALCQVALAVDIKCLWDDPGRYRDEPFYELLNFADNEGTIGPEAAADLAADFVGYRSAVRPHLVCWHQESYDQWARAFRLAAHTGLVAFG